MRRAFAINAFAAKEEPLLLLWLNDLRRDQNGDWCVTAVLRGMNTNSTYRIDVAFGLVPVLAPGRMFNQGNIAETTPYGQIGHAYVENLQEAEIVRLSDVPSDVFSDGRPRRSDQKLLLLRAPRLDLFIPPLDLIRRLFLHDRVLANVILRHGGLSDLWVPVAPGFPEHLRIQFTKAMPNRLLTERFVREFAWLAVHPTGAASWNSVARLSNSQDGAMLRPPKLVEFEMVYRGLFGGNAALVHEILSLPGKDQRFQSLDYSHPNLKAAARPTHESHQANFDDMPRRQPSKSEKVFDISTESSRVRGDPDIVDFLRPSNDFAESHGRVRRHKNLNTSSSARSPTTTGSYSSDDVDPSEEPKREVIKVTVSDISTAPELPPVSFRLLQMASPDYMGDLAPMLDTLQRMRELLPQEIGIATSLCAMPENSSLAFSGQHRRPCLVGIFSPAGRPPVVLLEIDHTGLTSLSALSIHPRDDTIHIVLERYVRDVLDCLNGSGRWPVDLESIGGKHFDVRRIKRMLRQRRRNEDAEYQTRWAAMLIEKLGF